jgi:ABC-2 type transport system ATP-binding protein
MTTTYGVIADGLGKRYDDLWALRDVDFVVPEATILGLLGHNGAGKTTALRILTTLASPTTGSATVAGYDVVKDAAHVRERIGVAAQDATVDGLMSARQNLEMVGRLYHLSRSEARARSNELLERVDLGEAADRLVRTFSGGMRRRLDLAASIVARPPVLFLDEPTTGLDPKSRNDLWDLLRELVRDGATLVLTTQYLDEADKLADDILVLDRGRVAATGSPNELKSRVGGERVEAIVAAAGDLEPAARALESFADGRPVSDPAARSLTVPVLAGTRLTEVVRALDAAGVDVEDVHRREATLDDVFLSLTGSTRAPDAAPDATPDTQEVVV